MDVREPDHADEMDTIWDGRIGLSGPNLNVGDEGAGKGLLAVRLAADLSTGAPYGPVTVAYASTEEMVETVVVPRLRAAGADLDRAGAGSISWAVGKDPSTPCNGTVSKRLGHASRARRPAGC